jgi:hypothetical protein
MGAGARLAEERDRWPDHWRVADLEQEEEQLLDLLAPAEELRAAVPGVCTSEVDGAAHVLIGVTDRRVVVIGRRRASDSSWSVRVADATQCAVTVERRGSVPFDGGRLELDLDEDALSRLWAHVDDVRPKAVAAG